MTQEQYVEQMLKVAYTAGQVLAQQDIEKESADQIIDPDIPRMGGNAPAAGQARKRGENPAVGRMLNRNTGALPKKPMTSFKQPGPKMMMGGRTPGKALQRD